MTVSNLPADQARVEALVGNPKEKFEALCDQIQQGVQAFRVIETEFLDLIWTMDTYRREQVVPRYMVSAKMMTEPADKQLEGIYRGKGNTSPLW